MTVNATTALSAPQAANGSNRTWYFPFKVVESDQIVLYLLDADADETRITSGYTVVGVGSDNGGEVTYPLAPTAPLADGITVKVGRYVVYEQPDRLGNQGPYLPRIHEGAFDRLEMQIQQVAEQTGRALLTSVFSPPGSVTLPPADPGHVLIWDENGNLANSATDVAAFETSALNAQAAAEIAMAMAASASDAAAAAAGVAGGVSGPVGGEWPLTAFGAKGDGVTDDLSAIQAAVDSGEVLYAPRGTYLIDGSIQTRPGLRMRGLGMNGITTFKSADFAHALIITGNGSTSDDVHLSDFMIHGNKANMTPGNSSARGMQLQGARFNLQRIWCTNVQDQAMILESLQSDCVAEDCKSTLNGSPEHYEAGGLGGSGFTAGNVLTKFVRCVAENNFLGSFKGASYYDGCVARYTPEYRAEIDLASGGLYGAGGGYASGTLGVNIEHGGTYIGCVAERCILGFYIRGQMDKLIIMGCTVRYCDTNGITIGDDTRGVHIGGGTRIYNNGQRGGGPLLPGADIFTAYNGIFLQAATVGGPVEVMIDDVQIYDNQPVKTQDYGISSTVKSQRCVIGSGCIINEHKFGRVGRSGSISATRVRGFLGSAVSTALPCIGNTPTTLIVNPYKSTINSQVITVTHAAHGRVVNDYVTLVDRSAPLVTLAADPLSVTNGSASVTVTHVGHGSIVGETVEIRGAALVGGIQIYGRYLITSVPDVDHYTFTHSAAATSTATGGGSGVVVGYWSLVGGLHIAGRFRIQSVPTTDTYTIWHEAKATATVAAGGGSPITAIYSTTLYIPHTGQANQLVRVASFIIPKGFLVVGSKFTVTVSGSITGTTSAKDMYLGTGTAGGTYALIDSQLAAEALDWWGSATFSVGGTGNTIRGLISGGHVGGTVMNTTTSHAINVVTNQINILFMARLGNTAADTITLHGMTINPDE